MSAAAICSFSKRANASRTVPAGPTSRPAKLVYVFFATRSIVYWSAIRALRRVPGRQSLLIVCCHAVQDLSSDPILGPYGVPPEQFVSQLTSLERRGFTFVGPDAFAQFVSGSGSLPRRAHQQQSFHQASSDPNNLEPEPLDGRTWRPKICQSCPLLEPPALALSCTQKQSAKRKFRSSAA